MVEEEEERERERGREGKGGREEEEKRGEKQSLALSLHARHRSGHMGCLLPCELDGVGASVGDKGVKVGLHSVVVALGAHLTLPQGYTYTGQK